MPACTIPQKTWGCVRGEGKQSICRPDDDCPRPARLVVQPTNCVEASRRSGILGVFITWCAKGIQPSRCGCPHSWLGMAVTLSAGFQIFHAEQARTTEPIWCRTHELLTKKVRAESTLVTYGPDFGLHNLLYSMSDPQDGPI